MAATILDLFNRSVRDNPMGCACVDDSRSLTYAELMGEVRRIATELVNRSIRKSPVVIYLGRSVDALSAMLGVAYSGNYYVILDPEMPPARAESILKSLEAPIAIVSAETRQAFASLSFSGDVICLSELDFSSTSGIVDEAPSPVIGEDLLYVLFTSGSTGVPKGVMIRHASMVNYAESMLRIYGLDSSMRIANQAPFFFDHSHFDIYVTIAAGGTLYIPPKKIFSYPVRALQYLQDHEINTLFWVPTVLTGIARMRALERVHVDTLERIILGAEAMPMKFLNMWRAEYPHALFANMYGPTEATVDCTYYVVDRDFDDSETLPIGRAVPNNELIVLDEGGCLIDSSQPGVLGELYVRGINVAVGYYGDAERTSASFVQNPLNSRTPDKVYRTGDLVSYDDRGHLLYRGRRDSQIKRLGYRIELGEVEAACQALDGVDVCCCTYNAKRQRISLHYVGKASKISLLEGLKGRVPHYMVPDAIVRVPALPKNANGKIDRKLIASWDGDFGTEGAEKCADTRKAVSDGTN